MDFEERTRKKGLQIFSHLNHKEGSSPFQKHWWYKRMMDWSMQNESFKNQMFRFVDVLPYLKTNSQVIEHLKEYFQDFENDKLSSALQMSLKLGGSLTAPLIARTVKKNIEEVGKIFITADKPEKALPLFQKIRKKNIAFTVDLLGEATLSEKEADSYYKRYIDLMDILSKESWSYNSLLDEDDQGRIPALNISIKLTSLYSQINEKAWSHTIEVFKERLRPLLRRAIKEFIFINIDMESYEHKDLILQTFKEIIQEKEFISYPHFGIVIQAYLRDSRNDIDGLIDVSQKRKTPFSVRLVKGAYWDQEIILAQQKNWPCPVFLSKNQTDENFENCTKALIDEYPFIKLALASHNIRSLSAGLCYLEKKNLSQKSIEIQMLYGMADSFRFALSQMGYRVREYATIGELIPGMAYLVRRLLENSSNESFLKLRFINKASAEDLLQNPKDKPFKSHTSFLKPTFKNEAPLDFSKRKVRDHMTETLKEFQLNQKTRPVLIKSKAYKTKEIFKRENPSFNTQSLGTVFMANKSLTDQAVKTAQLSFKSWKKVNPIKRAEYLDQLAEELLKNRYHFISYLIYEIGKPWSEADGELIEAVDFCRYYAEQMRKLCSPLKNGALAGEDNVYLYRPKGVCAVISPWNFPLAILTGMVSAALVTGNTVIIKPAEQSSLIAYELMLLFQKIKLPSGVVNYLPGYGEDIGAYLVKHNFVDVIAFTGSKKVGLEILSHSLEVKTSKIKRCIIEMGGKNSILIDDDADLDEAVKGVVYSAFSFQGQKCSACSRVVVLENIYDLFLERLIETTKSLHIEKSDKPLCFIGPVVDKVAFEKINAFLSQATPYYKKDVLDQTGYFIGPTIFTDLPLDHPLVTKEIFGPVLVVLKARNLDEALAIANRTEYGLTGGIYSRSPSHIEKTKNKLQVGNIYVNRPITGAIVNRHPFGGIKLSGVGSKTGGVDYLKQFMDPISISENTIRRGFATEV